MLHLRMFFVACLLGYVESLFGNPLCSEPITDGCPSRNCSIVFPEVAKECSYWCHSISSIPTTCSKDSKSILLEACCVETLDTEKLSRYRELTTLDLLCNHIATVPADVFRNNSNLTSINISNNRLTTIHPRAFRGLWKLKTLNLMYNRLETLQGGVFGSLANLSKLYLDNNLLEGIDFEWFRSLSELQIWELGLSYNKISRWPKNARNLRSVGILDLKGNKLTEWHGAPELYRLRSLDLSSNQIISISKAAFPNRNLQDLHLSRNAIVSLDPEIFQHLTSLQMLIINDNQLTVAHPQWFKHILTNSMRKNSFYSPNDWICDNESNCAMQSFLKNKNQTTTIEEKWQEIINITCKTPTSTRGKNLMDVDIGTCAEYNEIEQARQSSFAGPQPEKPQKSSVLHFPLIAAALSILLVVGLYLLVRRKQKQKMAAPASSGPEATEFSSLSGADEGSREDFGEIFEDRRGNNAEEPAYENVQSNRPLPPTPPPLPPRDSEMKEAPYFNLMPGTISCYSASSFAV